MGNGSGKKNAWVYGERKDTKKETKRKSGERAWLFKERLAEGKESKIERRCLKKLRVKRKRGVTWLMWKEKRGRFFEERELGLISNRIILSTVERAREKGGEFVKK